MNYILISITRKQNDDFTLIELTFIKVERMIMMACVHDFGIIDDFTSQKITKIIHQRNIIVYLLMMILSVV